MATTTKRVNVQSLLKAGFEMKSVKTWNGMEGQGFQANLYWLGKKVAEVTDAGNGGEIRVDWTGVRWDGSIWTPPNLEGRKATNWRKSAEKAVEAKAMLDSIVAAMPKIENEWGGDPLTVDAGWALDELCNFTLIARDCKRKTCFRRPEDGSHSYVSINEPFSPKMKTYIEKNYPGAVIINEEVAEMTA